MSVTTSARFNVDVVHTALGDGQVTVRGDATTATPKTVSHSTATDAQLQAAITTAAGQFVDRPANQATVNTNLLALIASLQADVTQDNSVISGANTIIATSGSLTTAQLSTHVRSLAQAVKTLASNDINNKKALANLLRAVTGDYDDLIGT